MRRLFVSKHFQKDLNKLSRQDRLEAGRALKEFLAALKSGEIPKGLGFKMIGHDQCEFRVGLRLRVAMKLDGDDFVCHAIVNHEAIRQFLRNY